MRLFCLLCAQTFLSTQSLITYQTDTAEGWNEPVLYEKRGYLAIEGLAKLMDDAHAMGLRFQINMNQQFSHSMLYATMMVNGTSVCTTHAETFYTMSTPQGYPYSRRPF